jgi:hypothetical protein
MKKEHNHIKQKAKWDCSLASIAMMTGRTYEEVFQKFKKFFPKHKRNGLTDEEIFKILKSYKVKPKIICAVILSVPGIMYLPSKNDKGGSHAVFFDGEKILDPNYRVPGKKYYSRRLLKKFPFGTEMVIDMNDKKSKAAYLKLSRINNE